MPKAMYSNFLEGGWRLGDAWLWALLHKIRIGNPSAIPQILGVQRMAMVDLHACLKPRSARKWTTVSTVSKYPSPDLYKVTDLVMNHERVTQRVFEPFHVLTVICGTRHCTNSFIIQLASVFARSWSNWSHVSDDLLAGALCPSTFLTSIYTEDRQLIFEQVRS